MFCPNCGKSDQEKNTYCRQCGKFLPDLSNNKNKNQTPEKQFRLSIFFNLLTALVGISMAIALLITFLGNENTPAVIYLAGSLFIVISLWQIISFFNNLQLRKRFIGKKESSADETEQKTIDRIDTNELLPEADFSNDVPAGVTENTTKTLKEKLKRSTHS